MFDLLSTSMPIDQVGILIAAVLGAMGLGGFGTAKLMAKRVQISTDDDGLRLSKDYITRNEHELFRAEVRSDFARMEAISTRLFERVDTKHLELLQTIERASKAELDGRVALWDDVKKQGNKIAALQVNVDVGVRLKETLDAISKQKGSCNHG